MADTKSKKKKDPEFTSPIGTFRYPKLAEPDYGNDKYPDPDGSYKVQLILPKDDPATQAFLAQLKPIFDAAIAEGEEAFAQLPIATRKKLKAVTENPFFEDVYDKDTEQPTGDIVVKAKLKASGVYKSGPNIGKAWNAKPVIYDAKGHRLVDIPSIWGGTRGRIAVSARPYFVSSSASCGLSLRLIGAKIITLVSAGERTADSLGFGDDEDGYVSGPAKSGGTTNTVGEDIDDELAF